MLQTNYTLFVVLLTTTKNNKFMLNLIFFSYFLVLFLLMWLHLINAMDMDEQGCSNTFPVGLLFSTSIVLELISLIYTPLIIKH